MAVLYLLHVLELSGWANPAHFSSPYYFTVNFNLLKPKTYIMYRQL